MALFESATNFILNLLTDNEELKKFPKEFIDEAVLWVKSWFLKPEDPKATAKLQDPDKPIAVKKDIIEDILEALKDNAQFRQELEVRLAAFEQQRARLKNVVEQTEVEVEGDVHIGDRGRPGDESYDEKNVVKDSTIKAGGSFRLGDDQTPPKA